MSASSMCCSELRDQGDGLRSHSWEGPRMPDVLSWRMALRTRGWEEGSASLHWRAVAGWASL